MMSSFEDERQEFEAPPASAWQADEELPTDPTPQPVPTQALDIVLLSGARRALWDAELATITGKPNSALLRARDALERITLVLAIHARESLHERLVSDVAPRLSHDRDARPSEHP